MERQPPKKLSRIGKQYWRKLAPLVPDAELNYDRLATLCESHSIYAEACENIREHGAMLGNRINPATKLRQDVLREIRRLEDQLQLNEAQEIDQDELDELLS